MVSPHESKNAKICDCRIAAFDDRLEAARAVDELRQAGFSREDIGFALRGDDVGSSGMITDESATGEMTGIAKGALTGGVLGTLLGAVATLVIPGLGPIIAGGIVATALGFGAAGVVTGGLVGALRNMGAAEEEAHWASRAFDGGKAIVAIRPGSPQAARAMLILGRHGGICAHRTATNATPPHELRHNVY